MAKSKNTQITLPSLGDVELKYISFQDAIAFEKLLAEQISDRDFVIKVLFHQLIQPEIDIARIWDISDNELEQLATAFIKNEDYTFRYLENTGDLFKAFKQAIVVGSKRRSEELRQSIAPILKSVQASLGEFNRDYARVIQQSLVGTSYIQDSIRGLAVVAKQITESQRKIADALLPILDQYQATTRILVHLGINSHDVI